MRGDRKYAELNNFVGQAIKRQIAPAQMEQLANDILVEESLVEAVLISGQIKKGHRLFDSLGNCRLLSSDRLKDD